MEKFKVWKEWLVDENNNIVKMTLREWFDYFKIAPCVYTYPETGNIYELWKSGTKTTRNGFIDIQLSGGYGLKHAEIEKYMDKLFLTGNADFDIKLVQID